MARHSHWAQIKLKKGAADVKRGKVFTRHARLVEMCARQGGGDPIMNPNLAAAIENARADNMPRDNIDRAIKKATGQLKDAAVYQEVMYEGFAPGGVALMIEVLSDNTNRTNQIVRLILAKHGGNLGSSGATGFLFEHKGEMTVKTRAGKSVGEDDELDIIDAGVQDIQPGEEGGYVLYTAPAELAAVRKNLMEKEFVVESPRLVYLPINTVEVSDVATAKKILEIIDLLEAEDDVSNVYTNLEVAESIAGQL